MNTLHLDICYRPLRVAWAIESDDFGAFRQAVMLSNALWGGRFNPILIADREKDARRLVDLFRVDMVFPIGSSDNVRKIVEKFAYLINPFFEDSIFVGTTHEDKRAQLLDVHNALAFLQDRPDEKAINDAGLKIYEWETADPLADVFLIQFGKYPDVNQTGIDYRKLLTSSFNATTATIKPTSSIPADYLDHPSISYLSRHSLKRHHGVQAQWDSPGFFFGDASNLDDLVNYWNLRAADISLLFVDPTHLSRYAEIVPTWAKKVSRMLSRRRHDWPQNLTVWIPEKKINGEHRTYVSQSLKGVEFTISPASEEIWNGLNVRAPTMMFDSFSQLAWFGREHGKPKVSFSLGDKPFSSDIWFHTQHLVASVSTMRSLFGEDEYTFDLPYVPELNEFFSRSMHLGHNILRVEPGRIGLVVDATDTDSWLYALPVSQLVERIFKMAGYSSQLSNAGLIARQLISNVGSLQGARVFKIPGVRKLLRTYGPGRSFTKKSAFQLIATKDANSSDSKFSDYRDLYIESRPVGSNLMPKDVFGYLVEKGLFRVGTKLTCPNCRMSSWLSLDVLKHRVTCEFCGYQHDASRQLSGGEWWFRRSGVMGTERNAQGAVPVALTLQQLETTLHGGLDRNMYVPSLVLSRELADPFKTEVDFVWIIPRLYPRRTEIILGECKDLGPIKPEEFKRDIENLRVLAESLPEKTFKTFILLSKLTRFESHEVELAKTLNTHDQQRTILLTERELEPYFIYQRTKAKFAIEEYAGTPEKLARNTAKIYFS